jgi:hypothetical protein
LLRAARAQARTPEFKQAYPTRSNIERTIAHLATQDGRRIKLRYFGITTNNAWLHGYTEFPLVTWRHPLRGRPCNGRDETQV